jgi:hypothetical protein
LIVGAFFSIGRVFNGERISVNGGQHVR